MYPHSEFGYYLDSGCGTLCVFFDTTRVSYFQSHQVESNNFLIKGYQIISGIMLVFFN